MVSAVLMIDNYLLVRLKNRCALEALRGKVCDAVNTNIKINEKANGTKLQR